MAKFNLNEYYDQALNLIVSGRARNAFDIAQEKDKTRDLYGRNTFGQSCLLARRLVEAGTRVVEIVWPKVANSDNHSWDVHQGLEKRMKTQSAPMLDAGLSALFADLDEPPTVSLAAWPLLRQVEAAGVLMGAGEPELARAFIDFMLTDDFQEQIPGTMFVYPAIPGTLTPEWWRWAEIEVESTVLDASAEDVDRWVREWTELMRR